MKKKTTKKEGCGCKPMEEPKLAIAASEQVSEAKEKASPCLPWVKVSRDPQKFRECMKMAQKLGQIDNSKQLYALIKDAMTAEDQEVFYVVLLDTQLYLRGVGELARGARDRVGTPIPDILRLPIVDGASAFAVAHNHPSGHPDPSDADRELTQALKEAADVVGIPLFDHLVVGSHSYYSFADHGEL